MKTTVFALSGLLLVAGCGKKEAGQAEVGKSAEDGVILAVEGELVPAGMVKEEDFSMEMKDGKIQITLPDQEVEGTMSMKELKKRKFESIAEDKYRITVLEETKTENSKMMGQEQPAKETVSAIQGQAVIVEKSAEGVWKGSLESGDATDEMKKEINELTEGLSKGKDALIYGTAARKVGDEWAVNAGDMMDIKDAEGTIKLRFAGIEDHKGQRCAKITGSMDITGSPQDSDTPGLKMRMSGDLVIFRSLEHRTDLSNEIKGTMGVSGEMEPQPGMKMKMNMEGKMEIHSSATVTKAK